MIDVKLPRVHRDLQITTGNRIIFNGAAAIVLCFFIIFPTAPLLGEVATFISLDLTLSIYLVSLFRSKYRFLFLIHPVFSLISSYGFEIPFTEIGVGFTYLSTFQSYVDPSTLALDVGKLWDALFLEGQGNFGIGLIYVGALPILWLPSFLFADPSESAFYLSTGVFTLLYAAIAVSVGLFYQVMRRDVLLILGLCSTVSPAFLEMNASLHRYGILFFGLFLFLIAYTGLTRKPISFRAVVLFFVLLLSIALIGISKAPLFFSLGIFVFLDRLATNKLPILSTIINRLEGKGQAAAALLFIVLIEVFGKFVAPENYVSNLSMIGGQYQGVLNVPVLNLTMRVVYAALSPFPWFGFDQFEIYGFNQIFLLVHILSSVFASWILLSFLARFRHILIGPDDIKVSALFGVSVLLSLAFSAIGFHVYLAPALPFLATTFLEKENRIRLIIPVAFCVLMEAIAQLMRTI